MTSSCLSVQLDTIVIAVYIFTLLHGFLGRGVCLEREGGGHNGLRCAQPKIITCSRLIKTGCNNVVLPTLFIVVENIVQHCKSLNQPTIRCNNAEQHC